jgi:glycosyltransferase involved in cell wall biosynthesis
VILFVSGEYPPDVGGLGDYTFRLRTALVGEGSWNTDLLSRREVRRWNARSLAQLVRRAPRNGIVHIQFQAGAYDLLGDVCVMPALLRLARPEARSVTTFHDVRLPYLFPRAGPLRQLALQVMARTSHAVVAADARDLRALGGPSPRHHHVPIGANVPCCPPLDYDRQAFRVRLGLERDDAAVAYFGLLNASKGLDLLLDAFERVLADRPRARLLLLGGQAGASDPTDRQTAASLEPRLRRLGDLLIQPGWLPTAELSAYLLAADVALLPYADGASGRRGSLLACAEHGLPIVSTQPAAAEVAAAIEHTWREPAALAEAVLRVLADPTPLRAASRALADRMSWTRIAADHDQIYRSLLYSRP